MRTRELDGLLTKLLESGQGISDINFTPGKPPQIEADGELRFPFTDPPLPELTPWMTELIALNVLHGREELARDLLRHGSCDCAYEVPGFARFRVNIFTQRGALSIVLRKLETRIPTIHDLVLPNVFESMAKLHKGLILITGATGQGKSTTMSALIHEMNMTRPAHIVMLEDPIEYVHSHQIGTVNQRELGADFDTWANGLRAAVRQAPKVIVIGELRDRETLETALNASDSGHLVLATMHTLGAGQTLNRIVGMFPADMQPRLRARLGDAVRYIVGQWLVPRKEGGRIAVLEILANNRRVRELIRDDESEHKTFYQVITEGESDGMQTFDQHLVKLYADDFIGKEVVLNYCTEMVRVTREMDRIEHERRMAGEAGAAECEPELANLKVDYTHGRERKRRDGDV